MDYAASHVVYVDDRVTRGLDGHFVPKPNSELEIKNREAQGRSLEPNHLDRLEAILDEIDEVRTNLRNILSIFDGAYTCASSNSCMERLNTLERDSGDDRPILVMIRISIRDDSDVFQQVLDESHPRSQKPASFSGNKLLGHLGAEVSKSHLSKRIVPLAMIFDPESGSASSESSQKRPSRPSSGVHPTREREATASQTKYAPAQKPFFKPDQMAKLIDLGAMEILTMPLTTDRLMSLMTHACRAQQDASRERAEQHRRRKARKLSWLGNNDERPYAYLREKMVSELMTGICSPDEILRPVDHNGLPPPTEERHVVIKRAIASWGYSGHEFTDDELIYVAHIMLEHTLSLPELEKWRISSVELKRFILASRAAYNSFVNYHNFRHVIDVMQAIFHFLVQIGTLPALLDRPSSSKPSSKVSPIAALLKPFDALTLLITAIGHDVGHPGVNNAFLVSLNAPLAQLYNDKSVLEAFHCAAYSQLLRRHWRIAFEDIPMRGLMINSILATDMGVHMKYMSDLGNLQEKLHHNQGTDGWSAQVLDEYRILTCALLIKCADISNVARPFNVALKWADSLQLEFANQGVMERELEIPTTLFGGPPELGNLIKLGRSQISFMNIFARPLFEAVTDILPAMEFAVDEMKMNQSVWADKIKQQESREESQHLTPVDRPLSPRSLSPNRPASRPESSHPEGLPASDTPSNPATFSPTLSALDSEQAQLNQSINKLQQFAASDNHGPTADTSRRSSSGQPLGQIGSNSNSATSFSRRSSGALSTSNNPHSIITTRRTSNSSPSQLQLGLDARSHSNPPAENEENRQPNGRGSEDTLSQMQFEQTSKPQGDSRQGSSNNGIGVGGLGSRASASEHARSGHHLVSQSSHRPNPSSGHHRSSSGAHTTNTNLSQSAPYSPTGTQATSFLTVESDENGSQNRLDDGSSPEHHQIPPIANVDGRLPSSRGSDSTHEPEIRTAVAHNGGIKEGTNVGYRSLGRKGSRFNFSFFKKKGKVFEASP